MSVDLESRLREEFSSVPLDVEIDAGAVLAAGRRAKARRTGGVMVTLAVVAAAALVAVPFVRAPGRPAVPEPVQTVTHATALFNEPIQNGSSASGVSRAVMDVERVGGASGELLNVSVSVTTVAGEREMESFTRPADQPWEPFQVNDFVTVAVLPSAEWVTFVSSGGGWGSVERHLEGMDLTAVLMVADEPPASIQGLIWRSTDGRTRDSLGNDVSAASLAPGIDVYADPALDVVGFDHDGQGSAMPLSSMGDDYRAILSVTSSAQGGSTTWSVFLLPPGAGLEKVTARKGFTPSTSSTRLEGGALDGREVVLVSIATPDHLDPGEAGALIESLTFTDTTGTTQTVHPGR